MAFQIHPDKQCIFVYLQPQAFQDTGLYSLDEKTCICKFGYTEWVRGQSRIQPTSSQSHVPNVSLLQALECQVIQRGKRLVDAL